MNAGAEYVLYRIWGALQDDAGIHPESLLTCVGALAGYACQWSVREALTTEAARDGRLYVYGDALNRPLTESPLSVRALVRRAVQKCNKPVPDIDAIFRSVGETVGTRAFGVLRVPNEHRPRHSAAFYVKQVWPQVLPIAERFCGKPTQLPVLFGIALQRAIEQMQKRLSPTLSASIALESAVAMSRAVLFKLPPTEPAVTPPPAGTIT